MKLVYTLVYTRPTCGSETFMDSYVKMSRMAYYKQIAHRYLMYGLQ